ncbi:MAG: hypothetical protein R2788_21580 [Saprospiraceae bacterium]
MKTTGNGLFSKRIKAGCTAPSPVTDHVFSRQDGFINWLADRKFGMVNIENFGYDFSGHPFFDLSGPQHGPLSDAGGYA